VNWKLVETRLPWGVLFLLGGGFALSDACVKVTHKNGLYYKHMTIINLASSIVNKLEALLTDDARVNIYDHLVIIVQATSVSINETVLKTLISNSIFDFW
jgi:hypothetical protein